MALVDRYEPIDLSTCMGYGMAHGCDENCPALWRGDCDVFGDVLPAIVEQLDSDGIVELLGIYLTPAERIEFIHGLIESTSEVPSPPDKGCKSIWE